MELAMEHTENIHRAPAAASKPPSLAPVHGSLSDFDIDPTGLEPVSPRSPEVHKVAMGLRQDPEVEHQELGSPPVPFFGASAPHQERLDVDQLRPKAANVRFKRFYESGRGTVIAVRTKGNGLEQELAAYRQLREMGYPTAFVSSGTTTKGHVYLELNWIDGVVVQGQFMAGKKMSPGDIMAILHGQPVNIVTEAGRDNIPGAPELNETDRRLLANFHRSLVAIYEAGITDTQFVVDPTGVAVVFDPLGVQSGGARHNEWMPDVISTVERMLGMQASLPRSDLDVLRERFDEIETQYVDAQLTDETAEKALQDLEAEFPHHVEQIQEFRNTLLGSQ
jgi:hypothetical protein